MSVKKYELAREIRKGVSARILNQAQEFSKCSPAFMEGWYWAGENMGSLYDRINVFLKSIGEEKIEIVEVMRSEDAKK